MGINLHYIEQGSGEPLILLHGNGEDSTYFKYQIEHFATSHRVIAVDTRGHGKSSQLTHEVTDGLREARHRSPSANLPKTLQA